MKEKINEELKYYKIKIEGDLIVNCKENDIESMVYHDLIENMEIIIKIKDKKEITEEEAYSGVIIDPDYYKVAKKRIELFTDKTK